MFRLKTTTKTKNLLLTFFSDYIILVEDRIIYQAIIINYDELKLKTFPVHILGIVTLYLLCIKRLFDVAAT